MLFCDQPKLDNALSLTSHMFSYAGKSSQVPQMLLEENMFPILCTQPRRLAVVAVAKRVAQERGCLLGEEVGYHIGQLNVSTTKYATFPLVLLLQPESSGTSMIIKIGEEGFWLTYCENVVVSVFWTDL